MAFDLDVFDKVAVLALEKYGWQDSDKVERIVLSENATYMIKNKTTGTKDGVLRISRPGYHSFDELNSEMKWLREINEYTPIIVANPIKGLNGEEVQEIEGPDKKTYYCVISEFLTGETPDEKNEEQMVKQFKNLGETTAYLHRQTGMWNSAKKLNRITWTFENMIGSKPIWGDWRDFPGITQKEKDYLEDIVQIIEQRLKRYGKNETNFGLIHADLRIANILIDGDQIKVIDFDDCGFGWHLHDMAAALSFIESKPIVPKLVNAWIEGYKKVLPFSDTDFKEIDTFLMMRRLQMTAWLGSHQQSGPAAEFSIGWMDGTMQLAQRYKKLFS